MTWLDQSYLTTAFTTHIGTFMRAKVISTMVATAIMMIGFPLSAQENCADDVDEYYSETSYTDQCPDYTAVSDEGTEEDRTHKRVNPRVLELLTDGKGLGQTPPLNLTPVMDEARAEAASVRQHQQAVGEHPDLLSWGASLVVILLVLFGCRAVLRKRQSDCRS